MMSTNVDWMSAAVYGRVQGVSFRYYTRREAHKLGIQGWVRNEPDGSVRVIAEGKKEKLENLLAYVNHGPPGAFVQQVDVEWSVGPPKFKDFEIRWR